jgi:NADH-quinone oxidoreductase subunit A
MLEQYFPVLLFILFGVAVGAVLLTVGTLLSPNRPDAEKLSPYECGFEAFEDARMKFDVRYYLVAILFILFDLEIAVPLSMGGGAAEIGFFGFAAMMIFSRCWSSGSSTNGKRRAGLGMSHVDC